jgi:hypothetical protein
MAQDAYLGVYCRRWGVPLIDGGKVGLLPVDDLNEIKWLSHISQKIFVKCPVCVPSENAPRLWWRRRSMADRSQRRRFTA